MTSTLHLDQLKQVLQQAGLLAALAFLNQRVPHRYSVVYRLEGGQFCAVAVHDKQNEEPPELFKRVPFTDSFCQFSVADGAFRSENTLQDHRLDGHVHQATVQSYTGLPIKDVRGGLYGTFCHMDLAPQQLDESEFAFLQTAIPLLAPHLPAAREALSR
jgi:hypothetical protein